MRKIWKWLCRLGRREKGYFVELDARDSSLSFSDTLYKALEPEIMIRSESETRNEELVDTRGKVMMFYEPESECYGFVISPLLRQKTQLAEVQFNIKHGTVGFESLVPTVARVLWDYDIKRDWVKLAVTKQQSGDVRWWRIERRMEE